MHCLTLVYAVFSVIATVNAATYGCDSKPGAALRHIVHPAVGTFSQKLHTKVILKCKHGYRKAGTELQATCLLKKGSYVWDVCGHCEIIKHYCPATLKLAHSKLIAGFGRKIHDKATLACNCGYEPTKVFATCVSHTATTGKWKITGSCKRITNYCDASPSAVDKKAVKLVGSVARYIHSKHNIECKLGYIGSKSDPLSVKCACKTPRVGKWVTNQRCKIIPKYCDNTPAKGCKHVKALPVAHHRIGATATGVCSYGYLLNGKSSQTIKCKALNKKHGRWDCKRCHRIKTYCSDHPEKKVAHSRKPAVRSFTRWIGSVANIHCHYGYSPAVVKVKCHSLTAFKGKWVAGGQCKKIVNYCPGTIVAIHGVVPAKFHRSKGVKVSIGCKCGYAGKIVAKCVSHTRKAGTWKLTGACKQIAHYCHSQPHLVDKRALAVKTKIPQFIGAQVRVHCKYGWIGKSSNPLKVKCKCSTSSRGHWSTKEKCTIVPNYCKGQPRDVCAHLKKVTLKATQHRVYSSFVVSCKSGYSIHGKASQVAKCEPKNRQKGYWKCSSCKLIPKYCNARPQGIIRHAAGVAKFSQSIGSVARVVCKLGFWASRKVYTIDVTCSKLSVLEGHWTAKLQCHHIPNYCDSKPEADVHAAAHPTNFKRTIGSVVHLPCLSGYNAVPKAPAKYVQAVCTKHTNRHGKWVTSGECRCPPERIHAGSIAATS